VTFDPVLVEKVATLLYLVMEDNPSMPRLYLTGVFYFVLMYTGSNVLPVARFLKYTHLRQAFRSDEVCTRVCVSVCVFFGHHWLYWIVKHLFIALSPYSIGKVIMFSGCTSAAFIQTDFVTMISREWLEQSP